MSLSLPHFRKVAIILQERNYEMRHPLTEMTIGEEIY